VVLFLGLSGFQMIGQGINHLEEVSIMWSLGFKPLLPFFSLLLLTSRSGKVTRRSINGYFLVLDRLAINTGAGLDLNSFLIIQWSFPCKKPRRMKERPYDHELSCYTVVDGEPAAAISL